MGKSMTRQRQPLRIPGTWKDQERTFVIQLERLLDELYTLTSNLEDGMVTDVYYDSDTMTLKIIINGASTEVTKIAILDGNNLVPSGELPLASGSAKGAIRIGYSETGQKYAVQLDGEKAYVEVPWTDTLITAGAFNHKNVKMFLIGTEEQSQNPGTYTNEDCYIGTDNSLYSAGYKVITYSNLYNGTDYSTAGQKALDAATGYILSTSLNSVRKGLLKVAVKSGSNWILSSGTNAAIGDFLSVNGTLGVATAAITGGSTVLVKNTNWEEVPGGILNKLQDEKADKVSGATANHFASLDADGNLKDSGHKHSDYITDVSGKADKVSGATNNNFAALDSSGNLKDSGHKHSDYLTSHQDISGKADKVSGATTNHFASLGSDGNLKDSGHKHSDYLPSGGVTWGSLKGV